MEQDYSISIINQLLLFVILSLSLLKIIYIKPMSIINLYGRSLVLLLHQIFYFFHVFY